MFEVIFYGVVLAGLALAIVIGLAIAERQEWQDELAKQKELTLKDKPVIKLEESISEELPYIILEKVTIRTGGDTHA